MTRLHEDRERHTAVEHRPGGSPIQFLPNAWCAIDVVRVKPERADAALASYETLIEKARSSSAKAGASVILRSLDNHRVIVLVTVGGHDAFAHLQSAWDAHHLHTERHDVAELSTLGLYNLAAELGNVTFDAQAKNEFAVEHIGVDVEKARALAQATARAPGFRGALVFSNDDTNASVLVYQFEHASEFAVVKTFG
jgi:hypothetical protein